MEIKVNTKPDELCAQLTAMARRLGPGARLPGGRELSQAFGVSRTTLQVALERLEREEVVSRKHRSGVFVSERLRHKVSPREVALICNFHFLRSAGHSAFWDILIEQVERRAGEGNEVCRLHLSAPTPDGDERLQESLLADLRAGRLHGVLGVGLGWATTQWLVGRGIPLVTYAAEGPHLFAFDIKALIRMGVNELGKGGCRRVGLWKATGAFNTLEKNLDYAREDEGVFRAALAEAGVPFEASLVEHSASRHEAGERFNGETPQEQGYRAALRVFGRPRADWPDGLLFVEDAMAYGALTAMQKKGVRIGVDVQVASHANAGSPMLMGFDDRITLLEVSPTALVQAMFVELETLMSGGGPSVSSTTLPPRLRARGER